MNNDTPEGSAASGQGAGNTSKLNVMSKELFLSLYLPAMAISLGQGIATPVLPVYAKSFGISFGTATLVVILNGIGGWVCAIGPGITGCGAACTAISEPSSATSTSPTLLPVVRFNTRPKAPSASCWQIKTTVRWKNDPCNRPLSSNNWPFR